MHQPYSAPGSRATRSLRARRSEIKRRYARDACRKVGGGGGVRLGELRRLLRARGAPEIEIANRIADLGDLFAWSAGQLGQQVELRWTEQLALGIRTIRCTDKTEAEITEFYLVRKRERDRMNKRMKRAAAPAAPKGLSDRAYDLLDIIERRWISASDLTEAASRLKSFPRDAETRRQAVHRAIKELHGNDDLSRMIDVDNDTFNGRGQRITTVRRHV